MSSRRVREKLREARIARDKALQKSRKARREQKKVAEDIDLEPKKKPVKKANKTSKKAKE